MRARYSKYMSKHRTYLQPREKIAQRSVVALSDHELLQAIIGSGSKAASVGVISRRILKLLRRDRQPLRFNELIEIPGLGIASTARIVASFELASRYPIVSETPALSMHILNPPQKPRVGTLVYVTLDGAHRPIARHEQKMDEDTDWSRYVSSIFSQCIKEGAASITIAVSVAHSKTTVEDLALRKYIGESAALFAMTLRSYTLYCGDTQKELV